jgi:sugar/nucleoside kinase (ribokinase family)
VDTLGAGDVFHGAFCYYFAQTGDFAGSLQAASRVAAVSCRYFGAMRWANAVQF